MKMKKLELGLELSELERFDTPTDPREKTQ